MGWCARVVVASAAATTLTAVGDLSAEGRHEPAPARYCTFLCENKKEVVLHTMDDGGYVNRGSEI